MRPDIDVRGRDWRLIEAWATARLESYRRQLEQVGLDEKATTLVRGKVAEVRALLALGQPEREPILDEGGDD